MLINPGIWQNRLRLNSGIAPYQTITVFAELVTARSHNPDLLAADGGEARGCSREDEVFAFTICTRLLCLMNLIRIAQLLNSGEQWQLKKKS